MVNNFTSDRKIVTDFFRGILATHGTGPNAVGYGNKESQRVRFEVLSEIGNLQGASILDVGCGLGDLYDYFTHVRGWKLDSYLGIDICPNMVEAAKKYHPNINFTVHDLLSYVGLVGPFDYVFGAGTFNIKTPHCHEFAKRMLESMFAYCKVAIGVNFLSMYTPFKKDEVSYYADPSEMLKFAFSLSPRIILRQDYKPNDFTIFVYKEAPCNQTSR